MKIFDPSELTKLYIPSKDSHKGQNGKLTIVGGSHLFHGASLWALKVASRIVDMVFYASVPENNELTRELKGKVYDFIAVPRENVEEYIEESDVVLIGPGLPRESGRDRDEESTRELTEHLLKKFSEKKWVIDAGSLTEMDPEWLKGLHGNVVITPHRKELEKLFGLSEDRGRKTEDGKQRTEDGNLSSIQSDIRHLPSVVSRLAKEFNCVILLKGPTDIVCSPTQCLQVEGGNAGMTKGGTGDVLAGLAAALACKNDLFLAATAASFINKKAGERLYKRVGPYFNASDLADEIPVVMKEIVG